MKKFILLTLSCFLFFTANNYAQSTDRDKGVPTCTTCVDSGNHITNNGDNTFTATAGAQAYFWRICSGTATIVGLNTNQSVTVSGTIGTTSKIMVTRFINGNCYESCEIFTIVDTTFCFDIEPQLYGKAYCGSNRHGNIKIHSSVDISTYASVKWYLDPNLNGSAYNGFTFDSTGGTISAEKTNSTAYFNENFDFTNPCPTGNVWYFDLLIKYNNGCPDYFVNDVSVFMTPQAPIIEVYPNPSRTGDQISFDGIDYQDLNSIEIFDSYGNSKMNVQPNNQNFSIKNLSPGIYIIRFKTITNEIFQKKLVIE